MSTVQRHEVILDHREKAEQGDDLHTGIAYKLERHETHGSISSKGFSKKHSKSLISDLEQELEDLDAAHEKAQKKKKVDREYFWDFNTVEQVLLSCAILVCLSGVMFESDRFSNDDANRYIWQRTTLTYAVILIVVFSLLYYFAVFLSEVMGYTPKWVKECLAKKQRGTHLHMSRMIADGDRQREEERNNKNRNSNSSNTVNLNNRNLNTKTIISNTTELEVELSSMNRETQNPLKTETKSSIDTTTTTTTTTSTSSSSSSSNSGSSVYNKKKKGTRGKKKKIGSRRNLQNKKKDAREVDLPTTRKKSLESNTSKKKKEFGQTISSRNSLVLNIQVSGKEKDTEKKNDKKKEMEDVTEVHVDDTSGRRYSFSSTTGVSQWLDEENNRQLTDATEVTENDVNGNDWDVHLDPTTGRRYSAHKQTGETKWMEEEEEEEETVRHQDPTTGAWYEVDKDGNTKWL